LQSLSKIREALAKAQIRLRQVVADEQRSAEQLKELEEKQSRWTARAIKSQQSGDEAIALACLKEKKQSTAKYQRLQQRYVESSNARARIEKDILAAEEKLQALQQKQHLLRSREAAANTLAGIHELESEHADDLTATFDRWEMKIAGQELSLDHPAISSTSALEQSFLSDEQEAELRQELASLIETTCNKEHE